MTHTSGLRTDHIMAVLDTSQPLFSAPICSPTLLWGRKYYLVLLTTLDSVDNWNLNRRDAAIRLCALLLHQ